MINKARTITLEVEFEMIRFTSTGQRGDTLIKHWNAGDNVIDIQDMLDGVDNGYFTTEVRATIHSYKQDGKLIVNPKSLEATTYKTQQEMIDYLEEVKTNLKQMALDCDLITGDEVIGNALDKVTCRLGPIVNIQDNLKQSIKEQGNSTEVK